MINLLDNMLNQLPKFRTKNWYEINDNLPGTNNTTVKANFKIQC